MVNYKKLLKTLRNKSKVFLVSFVSFALFFVFALMARPRLVVDNSFINIAIFVLFALPIVILSILNLLKVINKKKNHSVILDALVPLLILFPLYITISGFKSLFGELVEIYTFIPILLILSGLITYASNIFFYI